MSGDRFRKKRTEDGETEDRIGCVKKKLKAPRLEYLKILQISHRIFKQRKSLYTQLQRPKTQENTVDRAVGMECL